MAYKKDFEHFYKYADTKFEFYNNQIYESIKLKQTFFSNMTKLDTRDNAYIEKINITSSQIDKLDKHINSLKTDLEEIQKTNSAVLKLQQLLNIPLDTDKSDIKKITESLNINLPNDINLEYLHKITSNIIP